MAALIGLDDARIPELVARASAHGVFGVANRNSPGQVVVSGERPRSRPSLGIAKELGAKRAIELPVSVAAHSPLMAEAADGHAPRSSPASPSTTRSRRCSPTPTRASSPPPTAAAPSSSTT